MGHIIVFFTAVLPRHSHTILVLLYELVNGLLLSVESGLVGAFALIFFVIAWLHVGILRLVLCLLFDSLSIRDELIDLSIWL